MKRELVSTYLLASGLIIIILMVLGIFTVVGINGLPYFWMKQVARIEMKDTSWMIGEIGESVKNPEGYWETKVKVGNRKILGSDFVWIKKDDISTVSYPDDAVLVERYEWGNAYGLISATTPDDIDKTFSKIARQRKAVEKIENGEMKRLNAEIADIRHDIEKKGKTDLQDQLDEFSARLDSLQNKTNEIKNSVSSESFSVQINGSQSDDIYYYDTVDIYYPNKTGFFGKVKIAAYRFFEFLFSDPRESNTEGGIFPAIFGTVLLVILMSLAVFPLGVITAVFIHEYAKEGYLLKVIRNTIYNLAGVPSIVYGVFGLGFFVYAVGGSIDQIFFADRLPNPVFGTGGILWASLTLAVLTLPVVIVSSLEGLKSVTFAYREGAYSLGATKWEMIKDVVIPSAMPGMLTGLILAVSRAAGEVAPLMLTGVVKSAVSLPFDGVFPFLHLDSKFMHLGFHIYDVGFQSPNIEAARPMVFNTTLVLLGIVFFLNLTAILIRNRLRKKLYKSGV